MGATDHQHRRNRNKCRSFLLQKGVVLLIVFFPLADAKPIEEEAPPTQSKSINENDEDPERKDILDQLTEKIEHIYETKVQESLQLKAEYEDLAYNVIHKIIRKVKTVDARFRPNSLVTLGIPYNGVPDSGITDFEMMLQLSLGTNNSLYLHRERSGKSARIQPISSNLWQDCIDENSMYISPKRVTRVLRQYVKRAVYVLRKYITSKKVQKLPEGLTDIDMEDERFKIVIKINQVLRVTLLPAVSIPDSRSDMSRKDIPSTTHVVAVQLQEKKQNRDENNNEPPPPIWASTSSKSSKRKEERNAKLVWQYSFFVAEKNKLRTISDGCRIKLLRILTEIRDNEKELSGLTPYHLQTIFFHETERLHRRRDWKEGKMASRFMDFLRAIANTLDKGVCENYFMRPPDYSLMNLYEETDANDLQEMKTHIEKIIENPLGCLDRLLEIQS